MQCGERIVGDLRLGRADRGEEGRFAGIGQADQAGIGDQFQTQADGALLAGLARIGAARRLVGRALEIGVAEAAIAAFHQRDALAGAREIGEQRRAVLLVDLRADRNLEHHVLAIGAVAVLTHAIAAAFGLEVLLIAVIDQRVEAISFGFKKKISATLQKELEDCIQK